MKIFLMKLTTFILILMNPYLTTARWAPPNNRRPSAMISNLSSCNRHWKVQVAKHNVRCLAPPSRHNRVVALSIANPRRPTPQLWHTQLDDGQRSREDGHNDRYAQRGERKTETAQQDHLEKVGFGVGEEVGRAGRKSHASHGARFGRNKVCSCSARCSIK